MKIRILAPALLWLAVGAAAAAPGAADIDRFLRVSDTVCTGAQPRADQVASLQAEGVRTVINLRRPEEDYDAAGEEAAVREAGLAYIVIPVDSKAPKDEDLAAFLAATSAPGVFPIFLHCGSANRAAAFWMARRILVDLWSEEKALEEAERIGLNLQNTTMRDFALDYVRRHAPPAPEP